MRYALFWGVTQSRVVILYHSTLRNAPEERTPHTLSHTDLRRARVKPPCASEAHAQLPHTHVKMHSAVRHRPVLETQADVSKEQLK
jgi:hypothetical protein